MPAAVRNIEGMSTCLNLSGDSPLSRPGPLHPGAAAQHRTPCGRRNGRPALRDRLVKWVRSKCPSKHHVCPAVPDRVVHQKELPGGSLVQQASCSRLQTKRHAFRKKQLPPCFLPPTRSTPCWALPFRCTRYPTPHRIDPAWTSRVANCRPSFARNSSNALARCGSASHQAFSHRSVLSASRKAKIVNEALWATVIGVVRVRACVGLTALRRT